MSWTQTPLPPEHELDAALVSSSSARLIDYDISCRRCNYNLRGLHSAGACPECAGSIAESLRGDLLRYGDSAWLRRISWAEIWWCAADSQRRLCAWLCHCYRGVARALL